MLVSMLPKCTAKLIWGRHTDGHDFWMSSLFDMSVLGSMHGILPKSPPANRCTRREIDA